MKTGWETGALASISEVFTDGNWIESKDQATDGIRLVQTGNVGEGVFKERRDKARWIDEDTFARLNCFEVLPGDCLISRLPDPVGRACLIPDTGDKMITAVDCSIVRPDETKIDPRLLVYFTQSRVYLRDVDERCSGTTRRRISRKNLGKVPIPLPPLEEQQRIVGVLDEAFEGLACARKNAEVNLQNARELFESKRRDLLTTGSDSWATKSLNEVCVVERGSSPRPIKNFVTESADGVHWVKIGDTRVGSKYVTGTKQKITKKGAEKSRAVFAGDFILTNSMTYGRPYIMGIDGYIHDGWFVLRLKDEIDTDFFFHLLSSKVVQDQFEQLAAGSVVKNISGDLVKKAVLSLPPIGVQTIIASELDSISNDIERIEKAYTAKLQDLDDLRQSLLQQAFAGELT